MSPVSIQPLPDTSADLRALYRAAEARAARLRVLAEAGQALATASAETLDDVIARLAQEAAYLAGFVRGRVAGGQGDDNPADGSMTLPLCAPGSEGEPVGVLLLEGRRGDPSGEDLETLAILCQLLGGSLAARAREQRLALLLGELLRSQEDERSRIAHELHDGIAQSAAALMRRLELASDGDATDLEKARIQAQSLVSELRRVIAGMRPLVLDDLGLAPALRKLADDARERGLEVALDVALDVAVAGGARLDPSLENAMFRIVQEALNNACTHAGAGVRVAVRVQCGADRCRLSIRDNGSGFDPSRTPAPGAASGLGLAFMRKRAELLGGRLVLTSAPGAGCTIEADLPLP